MDVKFELLGDAPNGGKRWKIKALSVTTTRNNNKYTEKEMMLGARSLSFRPLNRNHNRSNMLQWPDNQTEVMDFDPNSMAVTGSMIIKDTEINKLIENGKITKLSIEQIPTKGETCDSMTRVCEQRGVVFTGLALLDYNVMPGDPSTEIKKEAYEDIPISELIKEKLVGEPFAGYKDFDACVADNSDVDDPQAYCGAIQSNTEAWKKTEWPKIEQKDGKLSIEDIANTWNSMNLSQRAHIIDPNSMYKSTNDFVQKTFDKMNPEQQKALIKTYGFRHSYNDVKHLLGKDDQKPPDDMIVDDKLLAQEWHIDEMDLKNDFWKLVKAGIKDPRAWSMSMQNPNNKTENNSLNSGTQTDSKMSQTPIAAKRWTKEQIDALAVLTEKLKTKQEIDSLVSTFTGAQNNKAPMSDKLADRLYSASDDELDTMARVTGTGTGSSITPGGLPDYKTYTQELAKTIADTNADAITKAFEKLGEVLKPIPPKQESTPSSMVDDSQVKVKAEMVKTMYEYYDVKGHKELNNMKEFTYVLDKTEYLAKYGGWQASGAGALMPNTNAPGKKETVTVSAGDMGQVFAKQVMLLPGGRMRVPIRQYCNFAEIPNGADRANWYTIGSFVFTTVTEGTEPTNVAQTVTKVQALPVIMGAVQRVGYSQVENAPFGLVDAINNAMVLAGLHDEAINLLSTGGAYWGTPSNVTNWVNGNSGANITSQNDDIASMTLTRTGLIAAKRLIAAGGYDTSPGNLVLFCHPKAYQDLMLDTNLNTYYQYARPDITATYVLEQLYGIDIVPTTAVMAQANTTNAVYRNVLAVKGWALGIAAAREITIEVQRRNEVQQLIISGMHRVKSAVIDYAASCGISSAQ